MKFLHSACATLGAPGTGHLGAPPLWRVGALRLLSFPRRADRGNHSGGREPREHRQGIRHMPKFQVTFPEQTFTVEAADAQEAACVAAYELARLCAQGRAGAAAAAQGDGQPALPFDWPGRIPAVGVHA